MSHEPDLVDLIRPTATEEARRQLDICNACRYCEGYCSAFQAITRLREFSDGDITQLANLCHNCRGCYYACQYTAPHEFALNLPAALAEVRQESWERLIYPQALARTFQKSGVALVGVLVLMLTALFLAMQAFRPASGEGFYAFLAHGVMVALFLPAFLAPLMLVAIGIRKYWGEVGGGRLRLEHVKGAISQALTMRNLGGGKGQGCNFEAKDRFSNLRRSMHQLVMIGFLLCFASTSVATLMHYLLNMPAPYGVFSLPKLLGLPGGLMMVIGCAGLAVLKLKADPALGAARVWGGEMAFIGLLGFIAASGLALYAATGTPFVPPLLAIHLAFVLAFFVTLPFTKMVHGFFRLTAMLADEQRKAT